MFHNIYIWIGVIVIIVGVTLIMGHIHLKREAKKGNQIYSELSKMLEECSSQEKAKIVKFYDLLKAYEEHSTAKYLIDGYRNMNSQ